MNNATQLMLAGIVSFFISYCCMTDAYSQTTPVQDFQLDNGLRVLVKQDHRAPVAVVDLWYKVGSSYEPDGLTGISHALEHMMFQGTPSIPKGKFSQIVAENGGQENAETHFDYTRYHQVIPADKLEDSLRLEADRMRHLKLASSDFNKEIEVVKEERRMRVDNSPYGQVLERFMAAAYLAIPYHHPIIGWESDLQHMTIDDLRHWYLTWYSPNNATLIISGDVKPEQVKPLVEKYFGKIKSRPLPTIKPHAEVPAKGERRVIVKAPAKLPYIMMGYNVPSRVSATDPQEAYALTVLAGILSEGNSSRLEKRLVRGSEVATDVGAHYSPLRRFSSLFLLGGTPAQSHSAKELQQAIIEQLELLQQQSVSTEELNRVKAQIVAHDIYRQDSLINQSALLGHLVSVGLPTTAHLQYLEGIKAVTADQVQQVAKKYLQQDNLTLAILEPQALSVSAKPVAPKQ